MRARHHPAVFSNNQLHDNKQQWTIFVMQVFFKKNLNLSDTLKSLANSTEAKHAQSHWVLHVNNTHHSQRCLTDSMQTATENTNNFPIMPTILCHNDNSLKLVYDL